MAGFSLRRLRRVSRPYAAFLASVALLLAPLTVLAGPTGWQVINGNVVFSQNGNIFVIHASNKAIINFASFNIGHNETVQFIQPSQFARVLNRITGAGPTQIDGKLLANGIVYLVNPAGVIFGPDSVVDVGGIYAAAANINNDRFINGIDRFKHASGSVINEGLMKGDFVHLIGQHVANHGVIVADHGLVTMLAGQDVLIGEQGGRMLVRIDGKTITSENYRPEAGSSNPNLQGMPGVENTGEIIANHGQVVVGAGDLYSLAIRNTGTIKAAGGHITIAARDGAIHNTGLLSASVRSGEAGTVTVRGPSVVNAGEIAADARKGSAGYVEVTSHDHTYLLDGSTISAAGGSGRAHGGEVLIHSYGGNTVFSRGALVDVSGGKLGGHGGFAEVSGKSLGFAGLVNLKAKNGYRNGHLLIDPLDIFIVDGPGSGDIYLSPADGDIFFADDAGIPMTISDEALEAILGDITLQAERDIFVEATVDLVNNNNIWFEAYRNIVFNAPIHGANNFNLQADSDGDNVGRLVFNVPLTFSGFGKFSGAEIRLGADITGADLLFNGPILLAADVNLTGDNITFFDTVDSFGSARTLNINSQNNGITTFAGDVGSNFQLFSLTTNADGVTHIGGNVSTKNGLDFNDDVLLTGLADQSLNAGVGMLHAKSLAKATGDLDLFGGSIAIDSDVTATLGSLVFHANAAIGGDVFANNDVTFEGNLSLTGAGAQSITADTGILWAQGTMEKNDGDLSLTGGSAVNLDQGATVAAGSLDVTGVLTALDSISAGTNITINDNASITGDVTADNGFVAFNGITSITGSVSAGTTIDFNHAASIASIGGSVSTDIGNITFLGGADIGGSVIAGDSVFFNSAVFSAEVGGDVNALAGSAIFNGNAVIGGSVEANDHVQFLASAMITGSVLSTTGNVLFADIADVDGDVTATAGSITFNGSTDIGGNIEAGLDINFNDATTTALVGGNVQSSGGSITFQGGADVGGFVSGQQNILFNHNSALANVIGAVISQTGSVTFNGAVDVGSVQAGTDIFFNNVSETALVGGDVNAQTGSVLFKGNADVDGSVLAGLNVTFENDALIGGNVNATNGFVQFQGLVDVLGNVTAGSFVTFDDATTTALVGGHVEAFGGDITFAGGANVGSFVRADQSVFFNNAALTAMIGDFVTATNGSIVFLGDAIVAGNVTANQNITFHKSALVGNLINGTGNVHAMLGFVDFNGLTTVGGDVTAGTDIGFNDSTTIATIGGTVDANGGDVTFEGGAAVGGNVIASDSVAFNSNSFATSVDGNVIATSGSATFNGETSIGGFVEALLDINFAHAISTAVVGQHVQSFGGSVLFAGGADVGSFVQADQNVEFNNASLGANVNGNVTAANGHAIFAGNANVNGTVHAGTNVSFTNALASALITGNVIADAGSVLFEGAAEVGGNVLASNHITFNNFSTVGGDVEAQAGNVFFALDTNLGGNVEAGGDITFGGTATFFGSFSQTVDAGGFLTANSTLTKTANGNLILGGNSGIIVNGAIANTFGALVVNDDMIFAGANITTSGDQTYHGDLLLANNTTLDADNSNIFFNGDINGIADLGFNLTVFANQATFGDGAADEIGTALGGALGTLTVNAQAIINAGAITTKFDQLFNGAVQVNNLATLASLNGGEIHFFDAITNGGAGALIINTAGNTTFDGDVTLASLTTDAPGQTLINASAITTSGDQFYGDSVLLGANSTLTGNFITFDSTLNGAFNLAIDAALTRFNGQVGQIEALGALETTDQGLVEINTDRITANQIRFNNAVSLLTSTRLHGVSLVDLAGLIDGNGNQLNIRSALTRIHQNTTELDTLVIRGKKLEANKLTAATLIDINVSNSITADGNLKYTADEIQLRTNKLESEGSMKLVGGALIDVKASKHIDSGGAMNFDADLLSLNTPKVAAESNVLFNTSGAGTVDDLATIVSRQHLVIDAGGKFKMGLNERFTSLKSLTINAAGATLGDLTTQNNMAVNVGEGGLIEILTRADAGNGIGTDFVSGGEIDFIFGTMAFIGNGPDPVFAPRDGLEGANESLQILVLDGIRFLELGNGLNLQDDQPLTLTLGDAVLDLDAVGPTSTDLSNALAGVLPEEETGKIVQPRASLTSAQRKLLEDLRISIRDWPENDREMARQLEEESRLTGRYVFEDVSTPIVGSSDRAVAEPRLSRVIAQDLFELRQLFWPYDEQTQNYKIDELRELIGNAFDGYRAMADAAGEPLDKVAFRDYIDALPQDNPALVRIRGLRDFMEHLALLGLNAQELARPREYLIQTIMPQGLTPEYIETLIAPAPEVRIGAVR